MIVALSFSISLFSCRVNKPNRNITSNNTATTNITLALKTNIAGQSVAVIVTESQIPQEESWTLTLTKYSLLVDNKVIYSSNMESLRFSEAFALKVKGTEMIIVKFYTGGAHCCDYFHMHIWDGKNWLPPRPIPVIEFNSFEDVNGDGEIDITVGGALDYFYSAHAYSPEGHFFLDFQNGYFVHDKKVFQETYTTSAQQHLLKLEERKGTFQNFCSAIFYFLLAEKDNEAKEILEKYWNEPFVQNEIKEWGDTKKIDPQLKAQFWNDIKRASYFPKN
jgi:hypothetical protein